MRFLGLQKEIVQLVPHRSEWAEAFIDEEARLRGALSRIDCEIEHVGSTSVPGLMAKPILDIAVGVSAPSEVAPAVSAIGGLGYAYLFDAGSEGGHVLVRESDADVRTHHLHVVALEDPQWKAYLSFRDFLRRSGRARDTYATEKVTLAGRYPGDREGYTAAKDEIVRRLLVEARRTEGGTS